MLCNVNPPRLHFPYLVHLRYRMKPVGESVRAAAKTPKLGQICGRSEEVVCSQTTTESVFDRAAVSGSEKRGLVAPENHELTVEMHPKRAARALPSGSAG